MPLILAVYPHSDTVSISRRFVCTPFVWTLSVSEVPFNERHGSHQQIGFHQHQTQNVWVSFINPTAPQDAGSTAAVWMRVFLLEDLRFSVSTTVLRSAPLKLFITVITDHSCWVLDLKGRCSLQNNASQIGRHLWECACAREVFTTCTLPRLCCFLFFPFFPDCRHL